MPPMERSAETRLPARLWWPLLALTVTGVVFFLFARTVRLAWAYDDIDYINHSANYFAGDWSLWHLLARPQGEHLVALFRLLLLGSLKLFAMSATPFRALTLLVHAATAVLVALLAHRTSGSRAAAATAAFAYVLPCGFSTMWLWFPSGSCVPWAIAFYAAAMLAIGSQDTLGTTRARGLALAAIAIALGFETTHAPLAIGPILLDEVARRRGTKPRWPLGGFAIAVVAMVGVTAWFSAYQYHRTFGPSMSISLVHGIPRALYLFAIAPLRYVLPSTSPPMTDTGLPWGLRAGAMGLAVALPVVVALVWLWRRGLPPLARVALLTLVGPIGVVALCGLGRWRNSYWELDYAGRYLFTLLTPAALLAGAVAATLVERAPRVRRWWMAPALALLALGAVNLALRHRAAMLARIPMGVYVAHAARYEQLGLLARRLEEAARALPAGAPALAFPDANLWFEDVHNGRISSRILMQVIVRDHDRLRLGGQQVGAADEQVLNPVLERWAQDIGEPLPYLRIEGGRLRDAHFVYQADFRTADQPGTVASGLYPWDGHGRWMAQRATLKLRLPSPGLVFELAAPLDALRRTDPSIREIPVDVAVVDSGVRMPLGTLHVAADGPQVLRLDATPYMARFGSGRSVELVLESPRTWVPAQVIPGSVDQQPRSVEILRAGAEAPPP